MTSITLLWTTLPNGIRRNPESDTWTASLSVFLTPRLGSGTEEKTLGDFSAFTDWPGTLNGRGTGGPQFRIEVLAGNTRVLDGVRPVYAENDKPETAAWKSVFSEQMPVRPVDGQTKSNGALSLRHYPSGEVINLVREHYANALAHELDPDIAPPSLQSFDVAYTRFRTEPENSADPLQQFASFHSGAQENKTATGRSNNEPVCPDFHEIVASTGSYPRLLRKLGLVLDFEIPLAQLGMTLDQPELRIRVIPANMEISNAEHISHWTAVNYTTGIDDYRIFSAHDRRQDGTPNIASLNDSAISTSLEKLEHATFSLMQRAQSEEPNEPLPALLQGGIRLTHAGVPASLSASMQVQRELESSLQTKLRARDSGTLNAPDSVETLYADALNRGYRVDVQSLESGQWRSLCARTGRYRAADWAWPAQNNEAINDEGIVEPIVFQDRNTLSQELRVMEDLFEWDGWSLVVPREELGDTPSTTFNSSCTSEKMSPFTVRLGVPPGSLEPQRFGSCYRFRIRNVDIAGNSLSVEEANALAAGTGESSADSEPTCYLRVESAKPPVVYRAQPRGAGEAGDVIVIRDAEDRKYRTEAFRLHVMPPQVPLRIAEKHGVFDALSAEQSWDMIHRHRGSLELDDEGNFREAITQRDFYTPYLPDPMVTQGVLTLPDGAGIVDLPRFDDLPRAAKNRELARACTLVVRPGKGQVTAKVSGREVTVRVPKGRVQKLKLAAKLEARDLELTALAHPQWQGKTSHSRMNTTALAEAAARGESALLAPGAELTVLYATQRPLTAPEFGRPIILPRTEGATSAQLADDALVLDKPSTGRIDVYASWQDPVDRTSERSWTTVQNELHAGGVAVHDDDSKPLDPAALAETDRSPLSHDFGDTRHHEVNYRVVAASRFAEFYPASLTSDPENITLASQSVMLHVPATAPPEQPRIAYVIPTAGSPDPELVSRTSASERQLVRSGEGLRVYMNRGWFSSGKGEQLALVVDPGDAKTDATPRAPVVSEWGLNPLRDSAPLPDTLQLEHVWGGVSRIRYTTSDDTRIALVLYDVQFSEEHGLPFVDIEFMSQRAFMPLVRLSLARYQAHAIPGCELSNIVQADFVPLTPGRALTVKKTTANRWSLAMRGYSYRESPHQDSSTGTSVARVTVEVLHRDVPEASHTWQSIGAPLLLGTSSSELWHYEWRGDIQIDNTDYLSSTWRRRLVIEEFEVFDTSSSDAFDAETLDVNARLISAQEVRI